MITKRVSLLSISLIIPILTGLLLSIAFSSSPAYSTHAAPQTTLTVSNLNDSGAGSLRQAIADATNGDTIDFNTNGTIILASQLLITESLTINGGKMVTVSGNNTHRVFNVITGSVTFDSLTIISGTNNNNGGGIHIASGTVVTVSNSILSGNVTFFQDGNSEIPSGGGIFNDGGVLTVDNSILSNNRADSIGGGIFNSGTLTVHNSTLSGNWADSAGGGIFNSSMLTVHNSTFTGNVTYFHGGGIFNRNTGTVTVYNSTLSGNSAIPSGGGILNDGAMTVNSSTLSGNSATNFGGGIFNSGMLTVSNSIIANSLSGDNCDGGAITSAGHNIDSDGSCGLDAPGDIPNTNPNLAALANNGGPTLTHALLVGSPAIDAGNCHKGPTTDQRGFVRPQDNSCDMGAFERLHIFLPLVVND